MAQLGYHVSMGMVVGLSRAKGTVLYLALGMIMQGYRSVYQGCSVWKAENFWTFATQSKNLNDGLEEQLKQFVKGAYGRKADYH